MGDDLFKEVLKTLEAEYQLSSATRTKLDKNLVKKLIHSCAVFAERDAERAAPEATEEAAAAVVEPAAAGEGGEGGRGGGRGGGRRQDGGRGAGGGRRRGGGGEGGGRG